MTPTPWRTVPLTDDYGLPGRRPPGATDPTAYLRTVEVLGADVHHLDLPGPTPDAPVVLLVHGLGGRWQHWAENLAGLAEHARVVALDLPGFGRSSPPRGGYAVDGFADVVAALARELALPPVTVVGHSLGALVALRLAQRHPDLVSSVVLAGGTVGAFAEVLGLRRAGHQLRHRPRTVAATLLEVMTAGLPVPGLVRRQVVARTWLRTAGTFGSCVACDLLERPIGDPGPVDGAVPLELRPFEVRTLRLSPRRSQPGAPGEGVGP